MGSFEDKLKGKIKEVAGKLTEDKSEEAAGLEQQRKGELKGELKDTEKRESAIEREKLERELSETKK